LTSRSLEVKVRVRHFKLSSDITIENDIEVFSHANEVPFGISFGDFAAEDIAIKCANAISILPRN
jgi:hypothetical protein